MELEVLEVFCLNLPSRSLLYLFILCACVYLSLLSLFLGLVHMISPFGMGLALMWAYLRASNYFFLAITERKLVG